jgi:polysaccharide deacetylase 2 family uncharacterized protein YibQ
MAEYNPTDDPTFFREHHSGALINNNATELQVLKAQRNRILSDKKEMNDLKSQLEQIKSLLAKGGINV